MTEPVAIAGDLVIIGYERYLLSRAPLTVMTRGPIGGLTGSDLSPINIGSVTIDEVKRCLKAIALDLSYLCFFFLI